MSRTCKLKNSLCVGGSMGMDNYSDLFFNCIFTFAL